MSTSDIREIKQQFRELRDELKQNTRLTQDGFEKMNERVQKLELDQARREGRDSVMNTADLDWKKVALALVGILKTAATAALLIAQAVLK